MREGSFGRSPPLRDLPSGRPGVPSRDLRLYAKPERSVNGKDLSSVVKVRELTGFVGGG